MILVILDGWGISKPNKGNAITIAKTPAIDRLTKEYPSTTLKAYGKHVGLPPEQDGNSESGHMNIGAGRIIEQDAVRISKSINDGTFFKNPAFVEVIKHVQKYKSRLHLMGMLSNGMSAHSDPDHLLALITLARQYEIKEVYLHLFTDGRDSPKYASLKLVADLERDYLKNEKIATIMGRYYAMDRKKKWARTEKTCDALISGKGKKKNSAQEAITESYNSGENDEFIPPYIIKEKNKILPRISDNDSLIFFNLRSDRARQLTKIFAQRNFQKKNQDSFQPKKKPKNLKFIIMTDFGSDLEDVLTAFPGTVIKNTLPMQFPDLNQLYIAETEKYAHVTYFFNGGYADHVAREIRMVIPSPDVKSYDETPTMSSEELTREVIQKLKSPGIDFTVLNIAAPDMIGHTGNLKAGVECCEKVDGYVGQIVEAYLEVNGSVIITADHGNIEEMINLETGEIDTEHSRYPVPFILVNNNLENKIKLRESGVLGDVAPTILELTGRNKPKEMTGKSLIKK